MQASTNFFIACRDKIRINSSPLEEWQRPIIYVEQAAIIDQSKGFFLAICGEVGKVFSYHSKMKISFPFSSKAAHNKTMHRSFV